MSIFYPNHMFHRVYDIPTAFLTERGITTLLLDIDNTLTTDNNPMPDKKVLVWLEEQKTAGIRLMLLSNNYTARVRPFAEKLEMEFIAQAVKPFPFSLKTALRRMRVRLGETALVGDQLFTDILCGRLAGCTAILVEPMQMENYGFYKIKRRLEIPILKRYRKKMGGLSN